MSTYYSILEFQSEKPQFLGKIPLVGNDEGVVIDGGYKQHSITIDDRTIPRPWASKNEPNISFPSTVDTANPFQVAPLASYYQRPYPALKETVRGDPEAVHVFTIESAKETTLSDVQGVECYENTVSEEGDIKQIERGYEWDETDVNTDVAPNNELDTTTFLIGYVDGQDMYDSFTHLGSSSSSTVIQAFHDVLTNLERVPLWTPRAYSVDEHRKFDPATVLNST